MAKGEHSFSMLSKGKKAVVNSTLEIAYAILFTSATQLCF